MFGAGAYFAELPSKADQYPKPITCTDCTCARDNPASGIFPLILGRVALGRAYGGLNAGRSNGRENMPVAPKSGAARLRQKLLFSAGGADKILFRGAHKAFDRGWAPVKKETAKSVIGAGYQRGKSKHEMEEFNDGLEFVVYDGSQVHTRTTRL